MISRVAQVRQSDDSKAVHVWGADYEQCAVACELGGIPVFRLESGGFCAQWSDATKGIVNSGEYRIAHELLDWWVVELRERGRALFKDMVVDIEEDTYSRDPSWGTDGVEDSHERELQVISAECAQRMKLAMLDDVLAMCAWRVFDRQRGILSARYGLGAPDEYGEVGGVLDQMGIAGEEREKLRQLWIASQAWW